MLFLTNWSSRKLHGPGRKLTIMAAPRRWEYGDGTVSALVPKLEDLRAVQQGQIEMKEYQARFLAGIVLLTLAPGMLHLFAEQRAELVGDGDTLLCACSKEAASQGNCHRVWAAEALKRAGWAIVLDGVVL